MHLDTDTHVYVVLKLYCGMMHIDTTDIHVYVVLKYFGGLMQKDTSILVSE